MTQNAFPRAEAYQQAVQNPRVAFQDPALQAATVETNPQGLPAPWSGGFALAYRFRSPSKCWAVRCFKAHIPQRDDRYQEICNFLGTNHSRFFVPIEYQPNGIKVGTGYFPITKMEWIDGEVLNTFVDVNIGKPQEIRKLAEQFSCLMQELERLGIAHGDLQHGNILVTNGNLKLVDYDGMFVPALRGRFCIEAGHTNYQHPHRSREDFNERLDRFSAIVIYLALTAISIKPALWRKYGSGGENLLFQSVDFVDPANSRLLKELEAIPELRSSASNFRAICKVPSVSEIPSLSEFLAGRGVPAITFVPSVPLKARRPFEVLRSEDRATLLEMLGHRVEVVGKITDIHMDFTRNGAPYAFVNFGDWRRRSFYLVLWAEALRVFREQNIALDKYIGHWISITGVIGQYKGRPQIAVNAPLEIEVMESEAAAEERLGFGTAKLDVTKTRARKGTERVPPVSRRSNRDRDKTLSNIYRNVLVAPKPATPTRSQPPPVSQPPPRQVRKSLLQLILDLFR